MGKLDGKIALVTGGTTGIGLAAARLFQQEEALVYVTGRNESKLAHLASADSSYLLGAKIRVDGGFALN